MIDELKQFKRVDDLSVEEHHERMKTGKLPESDAYREARTKALKDAGLQSDDEQSEPDDLSQMTAEQHYDRMRSDR